MRSHVRSGPGAAFRVPARLAGGTRRPEGAGLGIAGLLTYTSGIFAKDLEAEIGLSRTALGAAFVATVALSLALPLVVGWLVDRFGPRWPTMGGFMPSSMRASC